MIPTIPCEALVDIAFYQEAYPERSDRYREAIEQLKDHMRRLQTMLEGPPGFSLAPRPADQGT